MAMSIANILKVNRAVRATVETIKPDATVRQLAKHLKDDRIGAMVVTADGRTLDGIISERDIATGLAVHGDALASMKVSELMTKGVVVCSSNDSVEHAMQLMTQHRIRHLPVQDEGELVGVVNITDVAKAHLTGRLMITRIAS